MLVKHHIKTKIAQHCLLYGDDRLLYMFCAIEWTFLPVLACCYSHFTVTAWMDKLLPGLLLML